jgi:hypothetical protein
VFRIFTVYLFIFIIIQSEITTCKACIMHTYCILCVSCGVRDKIKEKHLSLFLVVKATKGLTALTPEINCDQTAIDLPAGVIPHSLVILLQRGRLGGLFEMLLPPLWG